MTATIQILLWRDRKRAARIESEESSLEGDRSHLQGDEVDEKKVVRTKETNIGSTA